MHEIKESPQQLRQRKAKALRYKKAALRRLNIEAIQLDLQDIMEDCSNVRYYMEDGDSTLLNALDGDEEEEFEFKMLFAQLEGDCERLQLVLEDEYVTEHFDDFLVGIAGNRYDTVGYDSYEDDYYSLCGYESGLAQTESGKRLLRLTKDDIISVAGQAFGVVIAYLNISQNYDYLKATLDILRNENTSYLKIVKQIDEAYNDAERDNFYCWYPSVHKFDALIGQLPDRAWLE